MNFLCRYRETTNVYEQKSIISKQRRKLTQQNNLLATMMGDNKFKYCDEKCFHLSSDCNEHELIHSVLKLYQCKYCDRCFNYPSNWKRHEVLHNGGNLISASIVISASTAHQIASDMKFYTME